METGLRRLLRIARAHFIYRLDTLLGRPPLVQLAIVFLLTAILVAVFAAIRGGDPTGALWWAVTHFFDGGTMAGDGEGRGLALLTTAAGIVTLSLLTAALASKMGERIGDLRSGLSPVMEHGHLLVLGFDPNVPLLAREIARSGQRCTLVVLADADKDKMEASLRPASRVPGHRLSIVVRTGDPRSEHALMRVSAQWARAVVVVPPRSLPDSPAVRWTLAVLLAMRRIADEGFAGHVIVEARRHESRALLELAGEPGVAGPRRLPLEVVASDDVIACILAQSTRDGAIYFVLRHLLAFDGCEPYLEPLPRELVGASFEEAHSRIEGGIVIGVQRDGGRPILCPPVGEIGTLGEGDRLVVLSSAEHRVELGARLPPLRAPEVGDPPGAEAPIEVAIVGCTATLPHLLRELDAVLPKRSQVRVACGDHPRGPEIVGSADRACARIQVEVQEGRPSALALGGAMCGCDAVVILGNEDADDENGDASALATLLQLRRGMNVHGREGARVVTELRDPRSAAHVVPREGDCVVSSDVVAMLLAQEALDRAIAPVYRELLHPGGATVQLRGRQLFRGATFAEVRAEARARGEIAIGLFPDPRVRGREREIARARLEEGDGGGAVDAWLHPPREQPVDGDPATRVIVLARA